MISENPSPDNDTMETLIETNEQLGKAMNQHQRAVLGAKKAAGLGTGTPTPPPGRDSAYAPPPRTESGFAAPPGPPPSQANKPTWINTSTPAPPRKSFFSKKQLQIPPPGDYAPNLSDNDEAANPFSDPTPQEQRPGVVHPPFPEDKPPLAAGQFNDRLGIEPYHPGFRETQSYVGRQDSSVGKVTMPAAGSEPDDDEEAENEDRYENGNGHEGPAAEAKEPVYRY